MCSQFSHGFTLQPQCGAAFSAFAGTAVVLVLLAAAFLVAIELTALPALDSALEAATKSGTSL